jgi:hypothetical protein
MRNKMISRAGNRRLHIGATLLCLVLYGASGGAVGLLTPHLVGGIGISAACVVVLVLLGGGAACLGVLSARVSVAIVGALLQVATWGVVVRHAVAMGLGGDWRAVGALLIVTAPPALPLCLVVSGIAAALRQEHIRRQLPGRCSECGYILTGLPQARCPECGTAFVKEERAGEQETPPSDRGHARDEH